MAATTSSAPAICGTFFGFTKLAASTRGTPGAASLSHRSARVSGGRIFSSFCRPSLGPTSTTCTCIGSPPVLFFFDLREHCSAGDEGALAVGQRSYPTSVRSRHRLLHLHRLEDQEQLPLLDLVALAHQHPHHRPRHRGREAGARSARFSGPHAVHVGWRWLGEPVALAAYGDQYVEAVEGEGGLDVLLVHEGAQPPVLGKERLDEGFVVV